MANKLVGKEENNTKLPSFLPNESLSQIQPQKMASLPSSAITTSVTTKKWKKVCRKTKTLLTFNSADVQFVTPSILVTAPKLGVSDESEDPNIKQAEDYLKEYTAQQETLIAGSYEKADNLLLTMSSAILGLSITFMGLLLGKHHLAAMACLILGWAALSSTIVCVLISHFTSRNSLMISIKYARILKDYNLEEDEAKKKQISERKELEFVARRRTQRCTERLNMASAGCFCLGVVLIVLFTVINALIGDSSWPDHPKNPFTLLFGWI